MEAPPGAGLYLSLNHNRKWYEEETPDNEDQWNSRLRITYSFAKDLSVRTEGELNSAPAGFANVLFRWKYRRNSFLYVGFNFLEEKEEENSRLLFVKPTYCF